MTASTRGEKVPIQHSQLAGRLHRRRLRFIRVIKEQCPWVEEFQDVEDARRKIATFIERYRNSWLLERHGYRTPAQVLEQALEVAA